jgi:hypothetical protein
MLKRIAVLAVMSALSLGFAATALAGNAATRVTVVKTDNAAAYVQEIAKLRQIAKRLAVPVTIRVWRTTFGGPNTGSIIVASEYPSLAALAEGMTKVNADPEYSQVIKGLDKIRTVLSDSIVQEL